MAKRLIALWLVVGGLLTAEPVSNWRADYPLCNQHSDLLKQGPLHVGVRFQTANPVLAAQFRRAMDFWSRVLDLEWYEDSTDNCAMEIVDGQRQLFEPMPDNMVARAQFPDRMHFEGWIVFNPALTLTATELYRISVHEIGHMFGLRHNSNTRSLMYDLDLECSETLDAKDLASLRALHKMRVSPSTRSVKLPLLQ